MTEGFVALMVTLIGASAGAMGMLAKWVTDRLDRRPRPGDIEITLSERIVDCVCSMELWPVEHRVSVQSGW